MGTDAIVAWTTNKLRAATETQDGQRKTGASPHVTVKSRHVTSLLHTHVTVLIWISAHSGVLSRTKNVFLT